MEVRDLQPGDVVPSPNGQMLVLEGGILEPLGERFEPNSITRWSATLLDGTELTSEVAKTFLRVTEAGGCRRLTAWIEGHGRAFFGACQPGEQIFLFTKRGIHDVATPRARQVNMPVLEIRRADGSFSRIYIHPEHGVVLSTLDLNL